MKKQITIAGEAVEFEFNAVTPLLYKNEFGRDFFADIFKMQDYVTPKGFKNVEKVNFNIFTDISFACAKTANYMKGEDTPTELEWLTAHPDYNVMEHGMEVLTLVMNGMGTKKK